MLAAALAALIALVPAWRAPNPDVVNRAVRDSKSQSALDARIVVVSDPFLGAPYLLSPLGEGHGVDADPRMRFDAFDCTTFVETTMALAIASNLDEASRLLDAIRYRDGHADYLARRHFPEAEWIPELVKLGFLQDITRDVGKAEVIVAEKKLDVSVWKRAKHKGMPALPDERIPQGVFALDVWPLAQAKAGAHKIPAGTVLDVVRVDFPTVPVRVSHQGIVVVRDGQRYLRHAADRMYHSVVDEPIEAFLSRMEKYGKWPVAGVHLARIVEPTGWRALLPKVEPPAATISAKP